jgi:hypothetical protein
MVVFKSQKKPPISLRRAYSLNPLDFLNWLTKKPGADDQAQRARFEGKVGGEV